MCHFTQNGGSYGRCGMCGQMAFGIHVTPAGMAVCPTCCKGLFPSVRNVNCRRAMILGGQQAMENTRRHAVNVTLIIKAPSAGSAEQEATMRLNRWLVEGVGTPMIPGYGYPDGSLLLWTIRHKGDSDLCPVCERQEQAS